MISDLDLWAGIAGLDEKEDLLPDLERNEKDFLHDLEDIRKE
jgi:hypothetical protein